MLTWFVLLLATVARASDLDNSFGLGGVVLTPIGDLASIEAVALQPDGKIVTVGHSDSQFLIARYLEDGSLDPSFGTGGIVIGPPGVLIGVAVRDGKIIVAGRANFTVMRFHEDGSLDTSFGTGGTSSVPAGWSYTGEVMFVQPDGKILVAGAWNGPFSVDGAVIRWNENGTVDSLFGTSSHAGITQLFPISAHIGLSDIAVQPDQKIVAVGRRSGAIGGSFYVARLNSDGSFHCDFNCAFPCTCGGWSTASLGPKFDSALDLALQADGRILATGRTEDSSGQSGGQPLARWTTNGFLDSEFGSGGTVVNANLSTGAAVSVVDEGRILVAGSDYGLARYDVDGSVDASFGNGGMVRSPISGVARRMLIQPDGKILVVGSSDDKLAMVRYGDLAPPGGQDLIHSALLTSDDVAAGDRFGTRAAIDGDTLIVAAPLADLPGKPDAGAAYVYVFNGASWTQQQKLTADDPDAGALFGSAVAISGDTIVVGAELDDSASPTMDGCNSGAAYVFTRSAGTWLFDEKLTPGDQQCFEALGPASFGGSVAISGDTVVVGARLDDTTASGPGCPGSECNSGSAYVFERIGGAWQQSAKLTASSLTSWDLMGAWVDIDGGTVVVGAPDNESVAPAAGPGIVFVFDKPGSGWTSSNSPSHTLTASDGEDADEFGLWLAIDGGTIVVGAKRADDAGSSSGSAYVFDSSGSAWSQVAKLSHTGAAGEDLFGQAVDVSGNRIVVSAAFSDSGGEADAGTVYVFDQPETGWADMTETMRIASCVPAAGDAMGTCVALDGDVLLAGTPKDDPAAMADAGTLSVYSPGEDPWDDLGSALAGVHGLPSLKGCGSLVPQTPVSLALNGVLANTTAWLVLGFSRLDAPFKGGTLVPDFNPPGLVKPLPTGALGEIVIEVLWPPGVPSRLTTYFQYWIQDPAGPLGYSASQALSATAP